MSIVFLLFLFFGCFCGFVVFVFVGVCCVNIVGWGFVSFVCEDLCFFVIFIFLGLRWWWFCVFFLCLNIFFFGSWCDEDVEGVFCFLWRVFWFCSNWIISWNVLEILILNFINFFFWCCDFFWCLWLKFEYYCCCFGIIRGMRSGDDFVLLVYIGMYVCRDFDFWCGVDCYGIFEIFGWERVL